VSPPACVSGLMPGAVVGISGSVVDVGGVLTGVTTCGTRPGAASSTVVNSSVHMYGAKAAASALVAT
jgi:hypothetical protein